MAKGSLGDVVVSGAMAFVAVVATLWFFGITLGGPQLSFLGVGFLAFTLLVQEATDRSVGFGLITLSLLVLVVSFSPEWLQEPLVSLVGMVGGLAGVEIGFIDPISFAVISIVFTVLMLIIRYRVTGKKKSLRNAFVLTGRDFQGYVREYMTVGRVVVLFSITSVVIALQQLGQIFGSLGDVIVEVPFIASNIMTVIAGYLSLGGDVPLFENVPLLGSLSAVEMLVFGLLLIGAAAAVKFRGRGPTAQFLRNRGL